MNPRNFLASWLVLYVFAWLLVSCASIGTLPLPGAREEIKKPDPFSRTYSLDFASFHPKMNSALQDYTSRRKGNSFQIARLGSDGIILRGNYQRASDSFRYPVAITAKPAGRKKTLMEIKVSSLQGGVSPGQLEGVARDLFRIVEEGSGLRPENRK